MIKNLLQTWKWVYLGADMKTTEALWEAHSELVVEGNSVPGIWWSSSGRAVDCTSGLGVFGEGLCLGVWALPDVWTTELSQTHSVHCIPAVNSTRV